jgi:hypothetical protein
LAKLINKTNNLLLIIFSNITQEVKVKPLRHKQKMKMQVFVKNKVGLSLAGVSTKKIQQNQE